MRNKYKEKKEKKEKEKKEIEKLNEKTIKIQDINLSRSKSPGSIMNKLDLLHKFNRLLFEKDKKRENSVRNELNIRRVNVSNLNTKLIPKEININTKGNNNNPKFKVIRQSSYSKFDNEESINKSIKNKNNTVKVEKEEIKKKKNYNKKEKYLKKKENAEEKKIKDTEKISNNDESKGNIPVPSSNYIKKQPEKYIKGNNKGISNKKNSENNKENNIIKMSNIEDFDKPKGKKEKKNIINDNKIKNKDISEYHSEGNLLDFQNDEIVIEKNKNKNHYLINSPIGLLKNIQTFKNDDIILNKEETNNIYNNLKKTPLLEKKVIIGKPRQTFQFLVHQAYKNRDLSNSFNKYYESGTRSREGSKLKNENQESYIDQKYNSRNKMFRLMKSPKNRSVTNIITFNKKEINKYEDRKTETRNNIKTINLNDNINNTNVTSSENLPVIKKIKINNNNSKYFNDNNNNNNNINRNNNNNNINNNNINNISNNNISNNNITNNNINNNNINNNITNNNIIINNANNKINEDKKSIYNKIINYSNNIINKNNKLLDDRNIIEINDNSSSIGSSQSTESNSYTIELEILYILDEKMKLIINRINNYQICKNECYNYIQYYFSNQFYNKILNFFLNKKNKYNISCYIKIEILCFFLCYDISFSSFFNQAAILLKTIFNIIHTNYLLLYYYIIINLIKNNYNNNSLKKILILLEGEPSITQIKNQEINEFNIIKIIVNNLKNINNYYKMIIDNIYGKYNNIKDDSFKFPNCNKNIELIKSKSNQYKYINIISSFFFDAYRKLNNYDFIELQKFFYLFLNQNNNQKKIINNNNIKKLPISNNNRIIYYLPKIKKCFKYSLVLDLDETLISFQQNYNTYDINNFINDINTKLILRPGLIEFLHNMKQFYELILFSSGTSDYVDPIVKYIEKNENFFEFVLYRQHISFDERGEYFKNLNLLNRNIKNILIIDDMEKNFKLQKENGICIKPFYGDFQKDINILNLLGQILMKIRIDADETGDIRISLNKEKKNIIYSKVAININD